MAAPAAVAAAASSPAAPRPTPEGLVAVTEGQATILYDDAQSVFYNEVQEFNRDLSISIIRTWLAGYRASQLQRYEKRMSMPDRRPSPNDNDPKKPEKPQMTIFEGLSATGLRSIRYAKEIPDIDEVVANDFDKRAVAAIKRNVSHNDVAARVTPSHGDANLVMYRAVSEGRRYSVVDLDPYGTAGPFLDAAVQAVADGGLLCITCTGMAVLAGSQFEACYAKYGSMSLPNAEFCHEMGLRTLLHTVQTLTGRHGRYIKPLLSLSIDFYIRVFVQVFDGPAKAKRAAQDSGLVYNCPSCYSFATHPFGKSVQKGGQSRTGLSTGPPVGPLCAYCESPHHVGGPVYLGPLHDVAFAREARALVQKHPGAFKTHTRITGMLTVASEELPTPLYYSVAALCRVVRAQSPAIPVFASALLNAGYQVSLTHCAPGMLKTDAPPAFLWHVLKHWIQQSGWVRKNVAHLSPGERLLKRLGLHADASRFGRKPGLVRFQINPTANWGPKARAGNTKAIKNVASQKEATAAQPPAKRARDA
ncbi:N2,N2-dimethylguanosine tRNA methyltransferase [Caulochytrium protostelioides]|uniref:tRNA (guanine(26)-N(2))-dimethyltransferase n=1 Tax=Caulochytrium protostelioides TaxID=1555241 RepID=A0A4P9X055_9FUNG|nr:N2,N2-dimethylguanosine tRNA methyltransferase [Caulochytrium protostelioides]